MHNWARTGAHVQLLAELPDVDPWLSGLAALPEEYAQVWRKALSGSPRDASVDRLKTIAQALSELPHGIGALHALANSLGVPTAGPRGLFDAATVTAILRRVHKV